MTERPQWIGDRLRAITSKRDPNTISDLQMMLRNIGPTPPMACVWDPKMTRERPIKIGGWLAVRPASSLPKPRNTERLHHEMREFAKAFTRLAAVTTVEVTDENQTALAYAAYRAGALTDSRARVLGVHDNAIRARRKQRRAS